MTDTMRIVITAVIACGLSAALGRLLLPVLHALKAGASINPATPAEVLRPWLHLIDRVLLMTVVPGFGGQKFMPEALPKVRELREMGFTGEIEADGGLSPANMREAVDAGVEILVMGTVFFKSENPYEVSRQVHAL